MQIETLNATPVSLVEVPRNGLAGLKHWRKDLVAGLIVALVSVPLSLGIAMASGAPPICGLTSEVIAGFIFPLIGGAYVTISGPAAGLAPVLYSAIAALGHGNIDQGYKLVLPIIIFAGLMQLVLTYFKAAKFSYLIPRAAVQGMLTSIGFLILAKQIPSFIGHPYRAHEFFGVLAETPSEILHFNPAVLFISVTCLALLFVIPKLKSPIFRFLPPHVAVVFAGIALAQVFHLTGKQLVDIPANPLQHGIVVPDFMSLFQEPRLIPTVLIAVLALTFVDGTESLATIHAIDQIDPFRRKSNPHTTLLAMGISNICSGFIGGLTIIPGIIKSSTCVYAGGRTAWANFYNAMFITLFLLLGHDLLRLIPIAALSAVLVHIAYKLAGPHQWQKMINLGNEQLLIFSTTVFVTVCSDLLVGIASGILMKVLILLFFCYKSATPEKTAMQRMVATGAMFVRLFKNPLNRLETGEDYSEVYFSGPLTCFNNLSVRDSLQAAMESNRKVRVILTSDVSIVDHSSSMFLRSLQEQANMTGSHSIAIEGLENLDQCSLHADSLRYRIQH